MKTTDFDSFRKMASGFSPTTVTRFLATQGWTLEHRIEGIKEIWSSPTGSEGSEPEWVMIPFATDYVDFDRRFSESLAAVSQIFDCSAEELSRKISSFDTDVLSVRLSGRAMGDTVSLAEGEQVIHGVNLLLKNFTYAAVAGHVRHGRGRMPNRVSEFMQSNVRLGQTRRGSFIITFTVLLDEPDRPSTPKSHAPDHYDEFDEQLPLARRMMMMLARAVCLANASAYGGTGHGTAGTPNGEFHEELAGMVLETIGKFQNLNDLKEIDFSFSWASALPAPTVEQSFFSFQLEDLKEFHPQMEGVRPKTLPLPGPEHIALAREEKVPEVISTAHRGEAQETIISGRVTTLERSYDGGVVTIVVDDSRPPLNVRFRLPESGYKLAVQAHLMNTSIVVGGHLGSSGRVIELENAVLDVKETEGRLRALS
ncbi:MULTISPECIES: hypothetical protein [Kitasatospora]|uniref:Uncharacterized protein n=1 Tax=Kitasatospora setae (strain ATCC 33774 / DSM 43861 / JCM 3304 / KCC A-0304 / NBRC 14216 / KM-6054) TaxID=452652 RepID=E4N9D4_KITSK|nr:MULTISPECIES: hypothetical protein [Kitasatospora]BAJ27815.1 hypothetical protein KSE_19920 [Kitasatospora setae KM-6054]